MISIYRKWLPELSNKALWSIFEYARYKKIYTDFYIQTNTINAQKNEHIAALNQIIAERDKLISECNQMINERDKQITERDKQITAILSSASWRLTKPLRKIKSFLCSHFI